MIKKYAKITLKTLLRNRLHNHANIAGVSMGLYSRAHFGAAQNAVKFRN